ncbi:MAG: sigma-70 family RNA polymerase sigma factor [Betaproteobacteria bacterium]
MLDYRGLFEGWEIAVAKQLVGRFRSKWRSLGRESFEDLCQECLVHWFGVRDQFDPGREVSPRAFMAQVVRNKLADILREHESDRRKVNYVAASLDAPIGDDADAPTLLEALAEEPYEGAPDVEDRFGTDARIDLEAVLARLTPFQQRLCRLLGEEGLTVQEASRLLGLPRATLYDALKRIRKVFAEFGLQDYLRR